MFNCCYLCYKHFKCWFVECILCELWSLMQCLLLEAGWSVESVLNDTRKLNILEDTIKLHILPPAQPLDALWTASFFTAGVQVPTMGFHSLSADKNEGFTSLVGPQNTVTLQDGEKEFCKASLQFT